MRRTAVERSEGGVAMAGKGAADVVIIGAGMAGLAAAVRLSQAGAVVRVLEARDAPGGRVRSDRVDGFVLDRGFQVLLTAYPEARALFDYPALDLRAFESGAVIRAGDRFHTFADPRVSAGSSAAALGPLAGFGDAVAVPLLLRRLRSTSLERVFDGPQTTTARILADAGLSARLIERVLRPFLAGVFLERELQTAAGMFAFVVRMFVAGQTAVPAAGMGALAAQLAGRLPDGAIGYGERVAEVTPMGAEVVARLEGGGLERSRAVVVATDVDVPGTQVAADRAWRPVTCLYYATARPPLAGGWLVLNGEGRGPVNNLTVMSEVSPDYAPAGQSLVSVTVLGSPQRDDEQLDGAVRTQLRGWFGEDVTWWRRLRVYRVQRALPAFGPDEAEALAAGGLTPEQPSGVFVAGDRCSVPSLNGALASGRRAAEDALRYLAVHC
jgi:phytoene dehydrogenase-like protein